MALKPKSLDMGMHTEQLAGRTQQRFFRPEEGENFLYPGAFDVDYNKRTEFDFMRGDEDYKYRFGGVDRFVVMAKLER